MSKNIIRNKNKAGILTKSAPDLQVGLKIDLMRSHGIKYSKIVVFLD